jgi:hypothetical protein
MQLLVVIWRTALQRFRDFYPTTIIDITLLLGAAIVVGLFHGTGWTEAQASSNAVMAMTTLATLTGVTFLRTFTKVQAKLHYGTNGSIPQNESPHCHNSVLVGNASMFQHVPAVHACKDHNLFGVPRKDHCVGGRLQLASELCHCFLGPRLWICTTAFWRRCCLLGRTGTSRFRKPMCLCSTWFVCWWSGGPQAWRTCYQAYFLQDPHWFPLSFYALLLVLS